MNRGRFLASIGAGAAGLTTVGVISGAATDAAGADRIQPTPPEPPEHHGNSDITEVVDGLVRAEGHRIHRLVPDGDVYHHTERFVSQDLIGMFGKASVVIDEGPVPPEYVPSDRRDEDGAIVIEVEDTALLGTMEDHVQAEEHLNGQMTIQSHNLLDYPLYSYKKEEAAERTGPINVGWDIGKSTWDIEYSMRNDVNWWAGECWCADYPEKQRYISYDGDVYSQTRGVGKSTGTHLAASQWHARLWYVNSPDGSVVAQAHYDVRDHGQILIDPDYRFDEARDKVVETWTNVLDWDVTYHYQVNGDGYEDDESAVGFLANIV